MSAEPVGVIGGSGFYSLLDDPEQLGVDTPYGAPSGSLTRGRLGGRDVVFVPRHGPGHRFAPQIVPYRANLWALRTLGVRQVVSLSAVGSLTTSLPTGSLVVPDQLVDRTHGRPHTFFDAGEGVGHVSFADPYCPRARAAATASGGGGLGGAASDGGGLGGAASDGVHDRVHDGGTLVVVNGPRFSTRAESKQFQSHGWSIIGMTAMPEAGLARELALCYTTLALVTDLDAGVEVGEGVTHTQVLEQFAENLPRLRELLVRTLERLPDTQGGCDCCDTSGYPAGFRLP